MDPRQQFCHNPDCSERGVVGGEIIVIHSRGRRVSSSGMSVLLLLI
jgi:hypothetical protein